MLMLLLLLVAGALANVSHQRMSPSATAASPPSVRESVHTRSFTFVAPSGAFQPTRIRPSGKRPARMRDGATSEDGSSSVPSPSLSPEPASDSVTRNGSVHADVSSP